MWNNTSWCQSDEGFFIIRTHDVASHIYYHCNGVLLASAIILWTNFLQGKIHFCRAKTSDIPPPDKSYAPECTFKSLKILTLKVILFIYDKNLFFNRLKKVLSYLVHKSGKTICEFLFLQALMCGDLLYSAFTFFFYKKNFVRTRD